MQVRYSDEKRFKSGLSIFLAGPTPRSTEVPSWVAYEDMNERYRDERGSKGRYFQRP